MPWQGAPAHVRVRLCSFLFQFEGPSSSYDFLSLHMVERSFLDEAPPNPRRWVNVQGRWCPRKGTFLTPLERGGFAHAEAGNLKAAFLTVGPLSGKTAIK